MALYNEVMKLRQGPGHPWSPVFNLAAANRTPVTDLVQALDAVTFRRAKDHYEDRCEFVRDTIEVLRPYSDKTLPENHPQRTFRGPVLLVL